MLPELIMFIYLPVSLNFLDDQGIDLVRPQGFDDEANNILASPMSEAEVLSALQVLTPASSRLQGREESLPHFLALIRKF